jgi:uncharacterized protein YneF (UPF0154 family)
MDSGSKQMIDIIFVVVVTIFFIVLGSGAFLLLQDSEKRYQYRKDLKNRYPDLNRDQIRLIANMLLQDEKDSKGN